MGSEVVEVVQLCKMFRYTKHYILNGNSSLLYLMRTKISMTFIKYHKIAENSTQFVARLHKQRERLYL